MICPGPVNAMFKPEASEPAVVVCTLSDTHAQRGGSPANTPAQAKHRKAYRALYECSGSAAIAVEILY
jgi:hypothetical protein